MQLRIFLDFFVDCSLYGYQGVKQAKGMTRNKFNKKKLKFIEVTKRAIGYLNFHRRALQNKGATDIRQGFS
jgi:hypothetical protein